MKKVFAILIVLSLVLAVSCRGAPPPAQQGIANLPPWINDQAPEDVFWGIGTARTADVNMSMVLAESRGRVAIARQLNTRVQAMLTDYFLQAGSVNDPTSIAMAESVSRSVTDMDVSGARRIQTWTAPDGTWWMLLEMNRADVRNQVASIINDQEAQFTQFRAQQALAMLDAQLAGPQPALRVDD